MFLQTVHLGIVIDRRIYAKMWVDNVSTCKNGLVSQSNYDVILVDVEPAYKTKLMHMLMQSAPYPELSREDSAMVIVKRPSVIAQCVELQYAVLLELLIELSGGTVDIRPAERCD